MLKDSLHKFSQSGYEFAHCFAGHGGSVSADVATMRAELAALIERM